MFNRNLFRSKVIAAGLTLEKIAQKMGIDPSTLDRKMSGVSDFSRAEIQSVCEILKLSNAERDAIFFDSELV